MAYFKARTGSSVVEMKHVGTRLSMSQWFLKCSAISQSLISLSFLSPERWPRREFVPADELDQVRKRIRYGEFRTMFLWIRNRTNFANGLMTF